MGSPEHMSKIMAPPVPGQREGEGVGAHWSPRCTQAQWWPGWEVKNYPFAQSMKGGLQHTRGTRYRRIIIDELFDAEFVLLMCVVLPKLYLS